MPVKPRPDLLLFLLALVHNPPWTNAVVPWSASGSWSCGSFIAGPFAGQLLGDYGADVIKVETPGEGDPMRSWGVTTPDGDSLWWPSIARNKRSVTADLRTEEGRDLVRRLAATADVVLENFRPGRLVEWGLDYDSVRAANPGVVMVHVSGFGQTGPRAAEAGFGSIGEAVGGIRHTTGDPDRPPARCGISLGDSLAALFAVVGTLAALHERGRSAARARRSTSPSTRPSLRSWSRRWPTPRSRAWCGTARAGRCRAWHRPTPTPPPTARRCSSPATPTGCSVACARRWAGPSWPTTTASATTRRVAPTPAELDGLVADWTRTLGSEALLALLAEHAVPAGRVYTGPDMLRDEHYAARDMVLRATARAGFDVPMTGIVPRFSRTPGAVADVGPDLGEHDDEVRAELG